MGYPASMVGTQPLPCCSIARHLVGKMVIQTAHLLITIRTAQLYFHTLDLHKLLGNSSKNILPYMVSE